MADASAHAARRDSDRSGHGVYSTLLPIPIVCFLGALATDVAYVRAPDMMWLDFSAWLLMAGLVAGGLAGLVLVVELVRAGRARKDGLTLHALLLAAAWVVEAFNSLFHARDGWTAVVPGGLALSVVAVLLCLAAGWFWQTFARRRAGGLR